MVGLEIVVQDIIGRGHGLRDTLVLDKGDVKVVEREQLLQPLDRPLLAFDLDGVECQVGQGQDIQVEIRDLLHLDVLDIYQFWHGSGIRQPVLHVFLDMELDGRIIA